MEALDAVLPVVAVAAPTVVVLRDFVAYDRGPAAPVADAAPEAAEPVVDAGGPVVEGGAAPVEVGGPVVATAGEPVAYEPVVEAEAGGPVVETAVAEPPGGAPHSMLSGLSSVETDERSAWRRVAALVALLAITLVTAAAVGAGIYNAVATLR